jgi:ornithine--oxo-acid transaminase
MPDPKLAEALLRPIHCLGAASDLGAGMPGCADAPEALRAGGVVDALRRSGRKALWRKTLTPPAAGSKTERVAALCSSLAGEVRASLEADALPLVLGGDHSCAIGTWQGAAAALADRGALGLVWIDAHLDAHVPESTRSGRLHGMALACLLGRGDARLAAAPPLDPRHVCVVGPRSCEAGEAELLQSLGVRVIGAEELRRRGLAAALDEALTIARGAGDGFGVTLDLDVVDPQDAPGVSVPEADGLRGSGLIEALRRLRGADDLVALEIAEYNPRHDSYFRTARLAIELACAALAPDAARLIAAERRHGAANYHPLPLVLARGEGCHLWDVGGRRYLDMMGAYSAASFGHCHPRLVEAMARQARRLAVTSRAFHNDRLPLLLARLTALFGYDRALPVNTGLEAVETALKAARKWAYKVKGVAAERAEIIACEGNFHGRSVAIVGLSSEPQYREGFGPFPPGLKRVPYGDAAALEAAITADTAAFLVEPVQGESGIRLPPRGYLAACAEICRRHRVLLICDEVQTGLGRTGRLLACEHEGVRPDGIVLGKALGGGLLPVSAFLADEEVMGVFRPGDHGSTFGGNPLAAAVALEALDLLVELDLPRRAAALGEHLLARLRALRSPLVREVRGLGLFAGVELDAQLVSAREACERLAARGVLSKDTHETVLRFTPPLVIERAQIDWAVDRLEAVLKELEPSCLKVA